MVPGEKMRKEIAIILEEIQSKAKQDPDYYSRLLTNLSECKNSSCTDKDLHLTENEIDVLRDIYKSKK